MVAHGTSLISSKGKWENDSLNESGFGGHYLRTVFRFTGRPWPAMPSTATTSGNPSTPTAMEKCISCSLSPKRGLMRFLGVARWTNDGSEAVAIGGSRKTLKPPGIHEQLDAKNTTPADCSRTSVGHQSWESWDLSLSTHRTCESLREP